jgi:hypothetical protein
MTSSSTNVRIPTCSATCTRTVNTEIRISIVILWLRFKSVMLTSRFLMYRSPFVDHYIVESKRTKVYEKDSSGMERYSGESCMLLQSKGAVSP